MSAELLALIVDDEYLDRLSAVELSAEAGLIPIETNSPTEAVALLKARSDIVMVIVGAGIVRSLCGRELVSLLEQAARPGGVGFSLALMCRQLPPTKRRCFSRALDALTIINKLRRLSRERTAPPRPGIQAGAADG